MLLVNADKTRQLLRDDLAAKKEGSLSQWVGEMESDALIDAKLHVAGNLREIEEALLKHLMEVQQELFEAPEQQTAQQVEQVRFGDLIPLTEVEEELVGEQEIQEMLEQAEDPFAGVTEAEGPLNFDQIKQGLDFLREFEDSGSAQIQTTQLATEAMKKKVLINQKAEEDAKAAQLQAIRQMQEE